MSNKNLTLKQSFYWILFSTCILSGTSYALFFGFRYYRSQKIKDQNLKIAAIIQTGSEKKALPTQYLAEKMGLSINCPTNYYAFDEKQAEQKLLSSPFIKQAKVKKLRPNAIYVDYTRRKPIAQLVDYENIGIDEEGYLFFLSPFYTKEGLVELFLGLPAFHESQDEQEREGGSYCKAIQCPHFQLAKKIMSLFEEESFSKRFFLKKIDVSKAFASSYGTKEIVLYIEEKMQITQNDLKSTFILPKYVRLNVKEYQQQLANFLVLSQKMRKDYQKQITLSKQSPSLIHCRAKLLDFRIPQLAFIKENE